MDCDVSRGALGVWSDRDLAWIEGEGAFSVVGVTDEHLAQWWAEHQEAVKAGRECPHFYCANGEASCRPFDGGAKREE